MKRFTTSLMFMLLTCIGQPLRAQYVNLTVSSTNLNSGSIGTAYKGQRLSFTYVITNNTSTSITNGTVICKIPAGTEYMPGTTTLNVAPVADVNGKMPFTDPGGASIGTLAPNAQAMIMFTVKITASAGTIIDNAIFKGTQNAVNIYKEAFGGNTTLLSFGNDGRLYTASVPFLTTSGTYSVFRELQPTNGTISTVYTGNTGPCYDAISGNQLPNGSLTSYVDAIAYDPIRSRLFFINNTPGSNLSYIALSDNPVSAWTFGDGNYTLSSTSSINRMGFSSAGDGYAITSDNTDLIKINTDANLPIITHLGALQNDPLNGIYNVMTETSGDIFGDGNGNMYLIGISGNLYRINPDTRVSTYLGTITGLTDITDISGASFDANGDYLYISCTSSIIIPLSARNQVFRVNLATMAATKLSLTSTTGYVDFGSGCYPVLSSPLTATQSWRDLNNNLGFLIAGDPIEVTITVNNNGNIVAPGAKVYNPIPTGATYISGTTTLNGVSVADINGAMPYSITGGTLIGAVKPGDANKAVVKFQIRTQPAATICNTPVVIYPAIDRSITTVNAETTLKADGTQVASCFYSEGNACGCGRAMLSGSLDDYQSNLNWSIEREDSIAYYEIEYASDNIHFNKLGKISVGEGKSFADAIHTNFGIKNYRLKIVQNNGRISYSDTVQLNLKGVAQVNPNPFTNKLNLRVELGSTENVIIRLMDMNGKVVYATTERLNAGGNNFQLDIPVNLAPGIYLSEVYAGNTRISQKKLVKL